jgi:hypothetical protein
MSRLSSNLHACGSTRVRSALGLVGLIALVFSALHRG